MTSAEDVYRTDAAENAVETRRSGCVDNSVAWPALIRIPDDAELVFVEYATQMCDQQWLHDTGLGRLLPCVASVNTSHIMAEECVADELSLIHI